MSNLFLSVIGIILAAVSALIAFDYGGDYFLVGYDRAHATAVANAGDNVTAGYSVFSQQYRRPPSGLEELTASPAGRSVLKTMPEVNEIGTVRPAWVGFDRTTPGATDLPVPQRAFVVEGLSPAVCRVLNERLNGLAADAVVPQDAAFARGCVNYAGRGVYVYYAFLKGVSGETITPYTPGVAAWQGTDGGGVATPDPGTGTGSGGSGGGGTGPFVEPQVGTVDADGWTFCARQDATCAVPSYSTIRFGYGSSWAYAMTANATPCTVAAFGSNPTSYTKYCAYKVGEQPEGFMAAARSLRQVGSTMSSALSSYWSRVYRAASTLDAVVPAYVPALPAYDQGIASYETWSSYAAGLKGAFLMSVKSPVMCRAINDAVNGGWTGTTGNAATWTSTAEGCYVDQTHGPTYFKSYSGTAAPEFVDRPTAGCAGGGRVSGGAVSADALPAAYRRYQASYVPENMCAGDYLQSPDGNFRLTISGGRLALVQQSTGETIWSAGENAVRMRNEPGGDVTLTDVTGNVVWRSATWNNVGARMSLRDGGGLSVADRTGARFLWDARSERCSPASVGAGARGMPYGREGVLLPRFLCVNEYVQSPDGRFRLTMRSNGQLSLMGGAGFATEIWSAGAPDPGAYALVGEEGGDIYTSNRSGTAVWRTNTWNNGGARMILGADGAIVVRNGADTQTLWDARTDRCLPSEVGGVTLPGDYGVQGKALDGRVCNNEYATSPNGRFRLTMAADGQLTLGTGDGYADVVWRSGPTSTDDPAYVLNVEPGGEVRTLSRKGVSQWSTRTYYNDGARFLVQDDGNLVVRSRANDRMVWQSRSVYCVAAERSAGTVSTVYGGLGALLPERVCNNEYVTSPNGRFRAIMKSDGTFAVLQMDDGGREIWSMPAPSDRKVYALFRESGGNVQTVDRDGNSVWRTATYYNDGAVMVMQDDGNLVVQSADGSRVLWQTRTDRCTPAERAAGVRKTPFKVDGSVVPARVCNGEYVTSPNGRFRLTMRPDGDLVMTRRDGGAESMIWHSDTAGSGGYVLDTADQGDFRVTKRDGGQAWRTSTYYNPGGFMLVQDDGGLAVYNGAGDRVLWESRSDTCVAREMSNGVGTDLFGTSGGVVRERLCQNEYVQSPNGRFRLQMDDGGALQVRMGAAFDQVIWSSGDATNAFRLYRAADGDWIALRRDGSVGWRSSTYGSVGSRMMMMDDGNVIILDSAGSRLLWESRSDNCLPAPVTAGVETSPTGKAATRMPTKMCRNEYVDSPNGRFRFTLEADGRVSLLQMSDGRRLWTNGLTGDVIRLMVLGDGDVVAQNRVGGVAWRTSTYGSAGARLLVQDDGDVAVYSSAGKQLWHTDTGGRDGPTGDPDTDAVVYMQAMRDKGRANVASMVAIPTTPADMQITDADYRGVASFLSLSRVTERQLFFVRMTKESTCRAIASNLGLQDRFADTSLINTVDEGCAKWAANDFRYWFRLDDAQMGRQVAAIRAYGANVYDAAGAAAWKDPVSVQEIGIQDGSLYNLLSSPGFEASTDDWQLYVRVASPAACRRLDQLINGDRDLGPSKGYSLMLDEGCGGSSGAYYYFKRINRAYEGRFARYLGALADRAISDAAAADPNNPDSDLRGRTALSTFGAGAKGFMTSLGQYFENPPQRRFLGSAIKTRSLCRRINRSAGRGDVVVDRSTLNASYVEGCIAFGSGGWYMRRVDTTSTSLRDMPD